MKLFAVLLGGRALRANTEVHDVVFVCGERIEDCHDQLKAAWFAERKGLHIDAWREVDVVDGCRVVLRREAVDAKADKLWFVNVGAYAPGEIIELHANTFVVARTRLGARSKGRAALRTSLPTRIHVDDVRDVDDCLAVTRVDGWYVVLEPTDEPSRALVVADYVPLRGR